MRISYIGAFPRLALVIFNTVGFNAVGFVLYGQPPASHAAGNSWFPGPASSTPIPYWSPAPHAPGDVPYSVEDPPAGKGTITVAELQHPLSRKARSLLLKAQTAMRAANFEECSQDLDKAMKIKSAVPYVPGVGGASYILRGRIPEAISDCSGQCKYCRLPPIIPISAMRIC